MKLARCVIDKATIWALVETDARIVRPIEGSVHTWGPAVTRGEGARALRFTGAIAPLDQVTFLAPIEPINRVVVAGANYAKHLVEFGVAPPKQPIAFLKANGALIGAHEEIRYPPLTQELDYEVELVVVIGAAPMSHDDPLASVLGYTVGNDVSARDLQRSGPPGIGMDLFAAKSQDRSTPIGPWVVTRDEFPAGHPALHMTLTVNGEKRQDGSTGDMTWDVPTLLRFIDERSSFACGDVVFTGTPEGVGQASGRYLNPGDVVEARIEGVGALRNVIGARR